MKKIYFQKFSFFRPANEKRRKSAGIQDFFPTWSVITPLFYMWFSIDSRGHKKAPKSQNIAVGPEDPPWVITRIQKTGWQRVKNRIFVVMYQFCRGWTLLNTSILFLLLFYFSFKYHSNNFLLTLFSLAICCKKHGYSISEALLAGDWKVW